VPNNQICPQKKTALNWISAIAFVKFDIDQGNVVEMIYPSDLLSKAEQKTLSLLSFPDSNSFSAEGALKFVFRLKRGIRIVFFIFIWNFLKMLNILTVDSILCLVMFISDNNVILQTLVASLKNRLSYSLFSHSPHFSKAPLTLSENNISINKPLPTPNNSWRYWLSWKSIVLNISF